jgi:calcineurin-like phosphoesterase family protein
MNYWLLTDTHFGHDRIQEEDFGARPFGFEEQILVNLKVVAQHPDIIIHLGDVSFYRDGEWHYRFVQACGACKKWLIRGNHDKKSLGWYYDHGWDFVADEVALQIYGKRVILSHKPVQGRDDYDLNIHGHLHSPGRADDYEISERHRLLFMEHHYKPFNLRRLVEA